MRKLIWTIMILSFVITSGCSSNPVASKVSPETRTPTPTITPVVAPEAGKSTVIGQVFSLSGIPLPYQFVRLAEVIRDERAEFYILDIGFSPVGTADASGKFIIPNITPGEYVIVVGDPSTQLERVNNEDGTPKVFNAKIDDILDVGGIRVNIEP